MEISRDKIERKIYLLKMTLLSIKIVCTNVKVSKYLNMIFKHGYFSIHIFFSNDKDYDVTGKRNTEK